MLCLSRLVYSVIALSHCSDCAYRLAHVFHNGHCFGSRRHGFLVIGQRLVPLVELLANLATGFPKLPVVGIVFDQAGVEGDRLIALLGLCEILGSRLPEPPLLRLQFNGLPIVGQRLVPVIELFVSLAARSPKLPVVGHSLAACEKALAASVQLPSEANRRARRQCRTQP